MPLYNILVIAAHNPQYIHIKELVRQSALQILDNGGVVRSLNYMGTQTLPQRMRRHKQIFEHGDYWTMSFDASPKSQKSLSSILRKDPRVIRSTVIKMGERPEELIGSSLLSPFSFLLHSSS
ncbi:uncharacterized protein STEHIDRAFT_68936 [Stereum hirsutum FP-91666 SS1]|uniref:Ribosomal protein S6 n=1 Tax=Stereum hirsutum (strain FP-91666) TaxID=721885 RepID=R7S010_STEHR|nr:uncharacterized protein STEHIDRAFT_68936 [Stereum hirsutum FP-91666 SS1]EIM79907.1 hypothetical protein STEHIDRAFT_68936 [Stereum hirsutum FP-91666 SS1]